MKEVERWYDERGLPLVVRVTPAVAHFDEALPDLGFGREGLTDVMVASLTSRETRDVRVSLSESPSRVWLDAEARLQGVSAGLEGSWSGIISRIRPPVGFAAIDVDGESVAAGFAVRDDDWVGLFEINVAASHRRRGLGRAISSALLDWGADGGAKRAYLQVVRVNESARALYRSLGFKPTYEYWYRRVGA